MKKAKRFLEMMNDLQWKIYLYKFQLEEKASKSKSEKERSDLTKMAELAGESAFEIETAKRKMEQLYHLNS